MVKVEIVVSLESIYVGQQAPSAESQHRYAGFALQVVSDELKVDGAPADFEVGVVVRPNVNTSVDFSDPNRELPIGFIEEATPFIHDLLESVYWSTEWADEEVD